MSGLSHNVIKLITKWSV